MLAHFTYISLCFSKYYTQPSGNMLFRLRITILLYREKNLTNNLEHKHKCRRFFFVRVLLKIKIISNKAMSDWMAFEQLPLTVNNSRCVQLQREEKLTPWYRYNSGRSSNSKGRVWFSKCVYAAYTSIHMTHKFVMEKCANSCENVERDF